MVGMGCEVPDHPAAGRPVVETVALALEIEQADDFSRGIGDELDRRPLVALLLPFDGIEERGVEERQETTTQPPHLVR